MKPRQRVVNVAIGVCSIFLGGYLSKLDMRFTPLIGFLLILYGICAIVASLQKNP